MLSMSATVEVDSLLSITVRVVLDGTVNNGELTCLSLGWSLKIPLELGLCHSIDACLGEIDGKGVNS